MSLTNLILTVACTSDVSKESGSHEPVEQTQEIVQDPAEQQIDISPSLEVTTENNSQTASHTVLDFQGYNHIYAVIVNGDNYLAQGSKKQPLTTREDAVQNRHRYNVVRAKESLEALAIPPSNITVVS